MEYLEVHPRFGIWNELIWMKTSQKRYWWPQYRSILYFMCEVSNEQDNNTEPEKAATSLSIPNKPWQSVSISWAHS